MGSVDLAALDARLVSRYGILMHGLLSEAPAHLADISLEARVADVPSRRIFLKHRALASSKRPRVFEPELTSSRTCSRSHRRRSPPSRLILSFP